MATVLDKNLNRDWEASLRAEEGEDMRRAQTSTEHARKVAERHEETMALHRQQTRPVHRLAPEPAAKYHAYRYVTPSVPSYYY